MGDSWTEGTGASSPDKRWTSLLSATEGWQEVNLGVSGSGYVEPGSGQGASTYVQRLDQVSSSTAEVVVSGGLNDTAHASLTTITTAVRQFYSSLHDRFPQAKIVAVTPFWYGPTVPKIIRQMGAVVRQAGRSVGAQVISGAASWLAARNSREVHQSGIAVNHPTDAGHARIARLIARSLS